MRSSRSQRAWALLLFGASLCVVAGIGSRAEAQSSVAVPVGPQGVQLGQVGRAEALTAREGVTAIVHAGYGGAFRRNRWTPVEVIVRGQRPEEIIETYGGTDLVGDVRINFGSGLRTKEQHSKSGPITIGGEKRFSFLILPETDVISVSVDGGLGGRVASLIATRQDLVSGGVRMREVDGDSLLVGVFGRSEPVLRNVRRLGPSRTMTVASMTPTNAPAWAEGWFGLDAAIVPLHTMAELSPQIQDALLRWARAGGHIVFTYERAVPQLPQAVTRALPATLVRSRSLSTVPAIEVFGSAPFPGGPGNFVAIDQVQPKGDVILAIGDLPLITRRQWGSGSLTIMGFDPGAPPFSTWPGQERMWAQLLPTSAQHESGHQLLRERLDKASQQFPDVSTNDVPTVLLLFGGYAVLIGGGLNWFLTRVRRLDLYWMSVWCTVGLVTLITLASPGVIQVDFASMRTVSLAHWRSGGDLAKLETYAIATGLQDTDTTIAMQNADTGMRVFSPLGTPSGDRFHQVEFGRYMTGGPISIGEGPQGMVLAPGVWENVPRVEFQSRETAGTLRVRNGTPQTLTNVSLATPEGLADLGQLGPGADLVFPRNAIPGIRTWQQWSQQIGLTRIFPALSILPPVVSVPASVQVLQIQKRSIRTLGVDLSEPTLLAWWATPAAAAGPKSGPLAQRGFTLLVIKPEVQRG